jgi:broad specificity phosphatase PhoE
MDDTMRFRWHFNDGGCATRVLLARHAEVHNPEQVLYGRLPGFPLSETGWAQARCLGASLASEPLAVIYTSPLLRARQTAAAIAAHHPEAMIRRTTLLQEVGSAWQGTPFVDFATDFNTFDNKREDADESIDDILQRMLRFLDLARERHPGQTVVGVTHGDPITILRVHLKGEPITVPAIRGSAYADLCSITEVIMGDG